MTDRKTFKGGVLYAAIEETRARVGKRPYALVHWCAAEDEIVQDVTPGTCPHCHTKETE